MSLSLSLSDDKGGVTLRVEGDATVTVILLKVLSEWCFRVVSLSLSLSLSLPLSLSLSHY